MIPVDEYGSFKVLPFRTCPLVPTMLLILKSVFYSSSASFFIVTAHMSPLPMQPSHWQLFNRTPAEWLMACQKCLYKSALTNHQDFLTIETVHKPPSTDLFPLISHSEQSKEVFSIQFLTKVWENTIQKKSTMFTGSYYWKGYFYA